MVFFSHFLNSKIGLDRFQNIDNVDSNDLISPQLTYSITHFYISIIIDCLFLYTYVIYLLFECMMLQGCSKGLHSNVKPPEPVKEENPADTNKDEVWERVCFLSSICSLLNLMCQLWIDQLFCEYPSFTKFYLQQFRKLDHYSIFIKISQQNVHTYLLKIF